jgi:hypothetical protein
MSSIGTPMPIRNAVVRKKHPMGTPAFPIAAKVERKIHGIISHIVKVIPWLEQTKKRVMRIKAAHPFMLMMEHKGRLKFAVLSETPRRFFAQSRVRGRVALLDFEKKAIVRAGSIPRAVFMGECPFNFRMRGRTINP